MRHHATLCKYCISLIFQGLQHPVTYGRLGRILTFVGTQLVPVSMWAVTSWGWDNPANLAGSSLRSEQSQHGEGRSQDATIHYVKTRYKRYMALFRHS